MAWSGGFILARTDASGSRTWTSSDGVSWSAGPLISDGSATIAVLEPIDDGSFVAAGAAGGSQPQPRVWLSWDGLEWDALAGPASIEGQSEAVIRALVVAPDRLIALGEAFIDAAEPYQWAMER